MGSVGHKSDDEYSVMEEKGDLGFMDFESCKDICKYNPAEESDIVTISVPFPLEGGKPQSGLVGETIVDSITIQNKTNGPIDLWSVNIYDSKPEGSFTLSILKPPTATSDAESVQGFMESFSLEDRVLRPNQELTIWLSCKPKGIGLHNSAVHFTVGDESETIERVVFVMAEDKISQSLASARPFNQDRRKRQSIRDIDYTEPFVRGSRPVRHPYRPSKYRLPGYEISKDVRDLIDQQQVPDAITYGLTRDNYVSYFHMLLTVEEIKMEDDMRQYDMARVKLKKKGFQFLSLEVPGLAEKRPSLISGDFVFARLSSEGATRNTRYQGFIHHVEAEEVSLKFREDFHSNHHHGNLYEVQFTYNRLNIRRLYQAIEAATSLESELLFPSEVIKERIIKPTHLVPISSMLNAEQLGAIEMILGCQGGSPYVIHGPPGTGKTMTLVEAILQVYTRQNRSRILVCAPSNSAADHILEKILSEKAVKVQRNDIFRLNAVSRLLEEVNPKYLEFCCVNQSFFSCPPLPNLKKYRIVISTYTSSCHLYVEGIKRGHFSHIFLDEAGQASEPETMIPISHLCQKNTVITLAGDPKQLGPLIFSKISENYGLGKSYLERLFECDFYAYEKRSYMTKLVRNYRSHPKILDLPSNLFYGGNLIPCKESDESSMPFLDLLPNKDFPLLFIGIQGCDEREGSNPSWFNRVEASKVVEIANRLIDDKGLREEDIGIITPYRRQVLKIKTALESFNKSNIKVGSVEQFQGQEKEVIIVSTVRSTIMHNEFDKVHYLGFLSNPRRFNVAVTRAKSLLILVGNPHIICKDQYWHELLWYCSDNESYEGCFLPIRENVIEEQSVPACHVDYKGENNWAPSGDEDWGDDSLTTTKEIPVPEPVYEEAEWSDGWKLNGQWGDNSFNNTGEIPVPEPVYDEAEWSDGWK